MNRTALIGYTGFVGYNLGAQYHFTARFNSNNIAKIAGHHFELVVCAGVQAAKWLANQDPVTDWKKISVLLTCLEKVQADRFVLISTIDVYPSPVGVDETFDPHPLENHPYGKHRLRVEDFVREHFSEPTIIRLPGLFGPGLKKNAVYDLLYDNCLEMINPESSFQYYYLKNIWQDVRKILDLKLKLINIATEPIPTQTILDRFFPEKAVGQKPLAISRYDFRSIHYGLWGGENGYLYDRDTILRELEEYIRLVQHRHGNPA